MNEAQPQIDTFMDDIHKIVVDTKQLIDDLVGRVIVSDKAMKHLNELYGFIWIEAFYDAKNDSTREFALKLIPHIQALNKELKFKK